MSMDGDKGLIVYGADGKPVFLPTSGPRHIYKAVADQTAIVNGFVDIRPVDDNGDPVAAVDAKTYPCLPDAVAFIKEDDYVALMLTREGTTHAFKVWQQHVDNPHQPASWLRPEPTPAFDGVIVQYLHDIDVSVDFVGESVSVTKYYGAMIFDYRGELYELLQASGPSTGTNWPTGTPTPTPTPEPTLTGTPGYDCALCTPDPIRWLVTLTNWTFDYNGLFNFDLSGTYIFDATDYISGDATFCAFRWDDNNWVQIPGKPAGYVFRIGFNVTGGATDKQQIQFRISPNNGIRSDPLDVTATNAHPPVCADFSGGTTVTQQDVQITNLNANITFSTDARF